MQPAEGRRRASLSVCFSEEDAPGGKKSSFSAEELDDEELSRTEACRPVRLCVHAFIFSTALPVDAFVAFCQKKSKLKGLSLPPRKPKAGSELSEPVFSPPTPQRTSSVRLRDGFYRGEAPPPQPSLLSLQKAFASDEATPCGSSFVTPGARLDGEQVEPDAHKAKKPVIKIPGKLKAKVHPAPASGRC